MQAKTWSSRLFFKQQQGQQVNTLYSFCRVAHFLEQTAHFLEQNESTLQSEQGHRAVFCSPALSS